MKKVLTLVSSVLLLCVPSLVYSKEQAPMPQLMLAKGPPAHAPAHGYRRKQEARHQYHYYPDAEVYFDPARRVYFYLSGGRWVTSATLPGKLKVHLGGAVTLDMDVDKPFTLHREHVRLHPPRVKIRLR